MELCCGVRARTKNQPAKIPSSRIRIPPKTRSGVSDSFSREGFLGFAIASAAAFKLVPVTTRFVGAVAVLVDTEVGSLLTVFSIGAGLTVATVLDFE